MERNCESCKTFPNCKACINESKYVDKSNGVYVILYLVGTLIIAIIIVGIFIFK